MEKQGYFFFEEIAMDEQEQSFTDCGASSFFAQLPNEAKNTQKKLQKRASGCLEEAPSKMHKLDRSSQNLFDESSFKYKPSSPLLLQWQKLGLQADSKYTVADQVMFGNVLARISPEFQKLIFQISVPPTLLWRGKAAKFEKPEHRNYDFETGMFYFGCCEDLSLLFSLHVESRVIVSDLNSQKSFALTPLEFFSQFGDSNTCK
jgi:hypothetical protein